MTTHALLLTDLVDSTAVGEQLGDVRAAAVWAEHDRRARELGARYHGREIGRTDGFLLLFDDVVAAARYALAYHREIRQLNLRARVGVHVGDVTLRTNAPDDVARGANATDVDGLALNVAARVMALARAEQTLLTAAVRSELTERLSQGAEIESHGYYRLKGIEAPVEIFELGDDIATFVPPSDADKAYRVVRAGDYWRPVREVRHNLPAERDAFVGRTVDLRAIATRLDAGIRLLTVVGPGGTGKTRLVRRYGWMWLGDWPGGVYFCDLSEARSLDGIYFAVASSLEVQLGKEDPALQLGHAIAGRGRCLLILDNFEQVLAHAPSTLGHWLDRAADAAFVVTSRERLHLPGETLLLIEPLPLDKDAVDLFAARAKAQRPDFALSESNRAAVNQVVRLLDGLPLAIELAAARARVLSPAQLVERLRDRFGLLAGTRGAAERQATLRAAIDWSWELLTTAEQAALAQCAVFEGGFTLEAAEAVLRIPDGPSNVLPVMDVVQALVDKSLLRTWIPAVPSRFDIEEPYLGMYLSIHEYAAEKLRAGGTETERSAEERHGVYFGKFGTTRALEALFGRDGVRRRRTLALELENLVAACRRAAHRADAETAVSAYRAAWEVLDLQGALTLGSTLGAQVLAIDGITPSLRAAALVPRAMAAWRAGRLEEAKTWFEQALALAREICDRQREASVLTNVGVLEREQGRLEQARENLEDALAIYREVGPRRAQGGVLRNLGLWHHEQARFEHAQANYQEARAIAEEVGDRRAAGMVLGNLGNLYFEQGRLQEARSHHEAALAIQREIGDRRSEGVVLGNLGSVYMEEGQMAKAGEHYEAALAIAREVGNRRHEGHLLGLLGLLHRALHHLDEALQSYSCALQINRSVGNRRDEGFVLGNLADLLFARGQMSEAREAIRSGETLLRELGDALELAKLLCTRGRIEASVGDLNNAQLAMAEAESVATAIGAGPDSELCHEISKLRAALV